MELSFSVVVPALNRGPYLAATIDSILGQRHQPLECIVVDGGSGDDSVEVLQRYGDRIRWVSERDQGHADAINKGWRMSTGAVLAWLNADDLYAGPDCVARAAHYLHDHPDVDVVYGDYRHMDPAGNLLPGVIRPRPWSLARAVRECDYTIPQPTAFMRRGILERIGWLDTTIFTKDHDLWLRIGLVGRIAYVPELVAYVRTTEGISQQGERVAASCIRITEKFLTQPGLPAAFSHPAFRRRAMSNAHLQAMRHCWLNGAGLRPTAGYFLRALACDPANLAGALYHLLRCTYIALMPGPIRRAVRGVYTGPP